jgi:gamma-glutamylcyclotransferase (GGCT)/AIG2-like uncharacterized protein YtfP
MHLFTYGTLMFPEVWQAVVGRQFESTPAVAPGYQIFRVKDAVFPGIIAAIYSGIIAIENSPPRARGGAGGGAASSGPRPSTLDPRLNTVPGLLYLNIDAPSIERLDRFEDDFYSRQTITVICQDGSHLEAHAYIVPNERRDVLTHEIWTADEFAAHGHLAEFVARYRGFGRLEIPLPPGEAG